MKLTFTEEALGWSVWKEDGESFGYLGKTPLSGYWVYESEYSGQRITLPELDQIRHKLANLEQIRPLQFEKE